MSRPSSLSLPAQELVLQALQQKRTPMTAYELLHVLKKDGVNSPPIIYRALQELTRKGKAHKIEALNAYIACRCASNHDHPVSLLTICKSCDTVKELHDHGIMEHVMALSGFNIRLVPGAVIEFPVTCAKCA